MQRRRRIPKANSLAQRRNGSSEISVENKRRLIRFENSRILLKRAGLWHDKSLQLDLVLSCVGCQEGEFRIKFESYIAMANLIAALLLTISAPMLLQPPSIEDFPPNTEHEALYRSWLYCCFISTIMLVVALFHSMLLNNSGLTYCPNDLDCMLFMHKFWSSMMYFVTLPLFLGTATMALAITLFTVVMHYSRSIDIAEKIGNTSDLNGPWKDDSIYLSFTFIGISLLVMSNPSGLWGFKVNLLKRLPVYHWSGKNNRFTGEFLTKAYHTRGRNNKKINLDGTHCLDGDGIDWKLTSSTDDNYGFGAGNSERFTERGKTYEAGWYPSKKQLAWDASKATGLGGTGDMQFQSLASTFFYEQFISDMAVFYNTTALGEEVPRFNKPSKVADIPILGKLIEICVGTTASPEYVGWVGSWILKPEWKMAVQPYIVQDIDFGREVSGPDLSIVTGTDSTTSTAERGIGFNAQSASFKDETWADVIHRALDSTPNASSLSLDYASLLEDTHHVDIMDARLLNQADLMVVLKDAGIPVLGHRLKIASEVMLEKFDGLN